ncbi:MAG: DUF6455 family protein [Pseudomonadota bacterium]
MHATNEEEIKPLGDEIHHYWLAVSMAKAAGIDAQAALEEGRLSQETWAGLITRCRGCAWERDGACQRWMEWALTEDPGVDVPEPCENRDIFEGLRQGQKNE